MWITFCYLGRIPRIELGYTMPHTAVLPLNYTHLYLINNIIIIYFIIIIFIKFIYIIFILINIHDNVMMLIYYIIL